MQTTTLIVRELTLPFSIGVLDHERQAKQDVSFNIDIRVSSPERPSESAQNYVSYAPVVEYLIARSESGPHIELIEELADDLFQTIFDDIRVISARIEVLKPEIFAQAEGVGVVIERENPAFTS